LGRMSFRSLEGDSASKVIAYSYDAAGRLIGSQHGDHAHRYSVDAAGNRLEGQQALSDNRLGQLNGTRYRYDGAGNLIERQQPNGERLTLGYDGANRLVHLIHASELGYTREATYRYDGLGRRISKTVRHTNGTTATTHYGWDGDRIVREETDNQRTTVVYEPGSFVPMLRIDDTQQGQLVSAYITDALGTPMQLVTPNGQPRWLADPDDWAAVKNQRAVRHVTQPIRFQGQWHDEESGLYYNRHRYYDPEQGRYISQDPIGLNGGTNLYQYASAPTIQVDPQGLSGVYGLGGGPYSQSNMVRRAANTQESSSKIVAAGLDVGGEVFGGIFGTSLATGPQLDTNGNACLVTTACIKFGLGAYAGAGVTGGASVNDSVETGITESWGFFMQGGSGLASGASTNFGDGVFGTAKGFLGVGAGGAAGVQFCRISTVCDEETQQDE
ncbi:RHS repeat-associated core domain-containing protein, partial [Halomonas llamarensis]